MAYHTMHGSDIGATEFLHIGVLDSLYTLNATRSILTRRYQQAGTSMRFGRVLESVTSAGQRFLLACGSSGLGTHEYVRSTNGTGWTIASALGGTPAGVTALSDAIVWDGQVIAHGEGDQIFGGVDGIDWLTDSGGVLDEHWRTGDILVNFIGSAMAPWGASAVYFLSKGRLWILDWYVYNALLVQDIGEENWLIDGVVWNGAVIVTDGWNVWEYNPGNAQTVRRIGLFGKDGPPPSWNVGADILGTPLDYSIVQFIPGTSDLFAICRSLSVPRRWRMAVYNGIGWSWYGAELASSQPYAGYVDHFPLGVSATSSTRYIDVAALDNQSGTDFTLHLYQLPTAGDVPFRSGGQAFANGPLSFETGWFDGGFADLEGALIRLTLDGYGLNQNETVQVEYRLNNDEAATYLNLGTFTLNQQELWFSEDHQGVAFKTAQFRITLDRNDATSGINVQLSPELKALILLFDKKPRVRTSWTLQIDVARTVERGIRIQGETATTERVWRFLKTIASHPTLVRLEVPSLESQGVNVRITDMPGAFEDIRPARGGRGVIDLQCIEVIAE